MDQALATRLMQRFTAASADHRRAFYQKMRSDGISPWQLPILPRDSTCSRIVPSSSAQLRQWFLWQIDPSSAAYHITGALRLRGRLDMRALHASFATLLARHEALRTVFKATVDGLANQVVLDQVDVGIEVLDARTDEVLAMAASVAERPFDLSEGPLLRTALIREADDAHVLMVVMHHIVSDGGSMRILVDEFFTLYRAAVEGRTPVLPTLAVQYADYALWQRYWLDAGERDRQLDYWRQQLGEKHPVLQLPSDRPRRTDGRYTSARYFIELPAAIVRGLRRSVQAEGATLFMALVTGFQVLLQRHTGLTDIRFGVPVANRQRIEVERVVGFFANTLVLRTRVYGRLSLRDALAQTKRTVLEAQAHQDLPFEHLVEALRPERSLTTTPLFQVMFNHLLEDKRSIERLPGLIAEPYEALVPPAQFELSLQTREHETGRVEASFTYAADLFDQRTIERMASHYVSVLRALAEQPALTVGDVELLSEAERRQLRDWSENRAAHGDPVPVHRLIERQVQAQPQATALLFGERRLSYAELNERANRLAHRLSAAGVTPDTLVGVAMERSMELVISLLAILKAGGAYVPIDPTYPSERIGFMLDDCGTRWLLTQRKLRKALPLRSELSVIEVDGLDLSAEPHHDPAVPLHGENLVYLIYTSGSTGTPKGAANRHRSLYNRLQWMQDAYRLSAADTVLQKTPYSFDVSVWEFFWPLMVGARLAIAAPEDHRDPVRLLELIQRHRVTTLHFVPSMLQAFLAHPGIEQCESLVRVVCSGEALPAHAQSEVMRRLPDTALYNLYGPTEAAIDVTHWTCRDDGRNQVPIGQPISATQTYVFDDELNLVPPGVAGELYLGGEGLARGYWQRAGLTAQRFIADPLSNDGARLYRTGDVVRWNGQGQLEYLGRIDHQVKIRGFRIELGEIEAQLLAQPQVREAVVVAKAGAGGPRVVGYVVGPDSGQVSAIRERLAQVLPEYMVPSALVVLAQLPLNANGKMDRAALPDLELTSERAYEPPQGEVERALALIWADVLGVDRVGRQDNFFELGGHSLLALRLLERLRTQGWNATVRTLFQHPQLASFAQSLAQPRLRPERVVPPNLIPPQCSAISPEMLTLVSLEAEQIRRIEAAVPGGAANIQDIYPLAPLQEGILFHHLLDSERDAYITRSLLSFDSEARLRRFVDSFNQVIARHDILRTAVHWEALTEPVQVVQREACVQLEWLPNEPSDDGADVAAAANVRASLHAYVHSRHAHIEVNRAPLIRAIAAHDVTAERWLLQVLCHHLVLDHTTLERIVAEIGLIEQGQVHSLPEPVPFRQFVAEARLSNSVAEHTAFFTARLGDVSEPSAPFGLLDVQGDGADMEEAHRTLPPALAAALRAQARRYGVSAATLVHLAWAVVVGRTTGQDDVVFGTVLFGRMLGGAGIEQALGLFINTLPLRLQLGSRTIEQCVEQTQGQLTELLHHEHASLTLAQRCSGLPAGTPLFSTLLNYRYSVAASSPPIVDGMEVLAGEERTNYPITMSVDDLGEGFELVAQVPPSVGAQRLCGYLQQAITEMVDALAHEPQRPVCELTVLSETEQAELRARGDNRETYPDALPLHHWIEQQVEARPQATALIFGEQKLSYAELNRRANRLAHRLIAAGVRAESKVGVALERSVEMVVGLLAILKAGGAYVPLDPRYPAERLAYLAHDSGIEWLLTQRDLEGQLPEQLRTSASMQVVVLDALATHDDQQGSSTRINEQGSTQDGEQAGSTRDDEQGNRQDNEQGRTQDDLRDSRDFDENPRVPVHADQLAYVIYTSGSTGTPKGAQLCHRNVSRLLSATQRWFDFGPSDVWTLFHSYAFDFSVWEIFGALCTGGTQVIVPYWVSRSPREFLQLLREQRVTVLNQTPSAFTQLVALPEAYEHELALRLVIFGGEALDPQRLRPWIEHWGDAQPRLINMYGITETTVHVTYRQITRADLQAQRSPIGIAIPDLGLRVLDGALNEVPTGVAGELYVAGEGLARGYWQRAGLTAQRFIADPVSNDGARLYRTGDVVRWNVLGELEYLGRIDHQVKIRGFRIELGEIEAQLLAQPQVREAVVVAKAGATGPRVIGYVVGPDSSQVSAIRERLAKVLPEYMVPSALVVLAQLPLNVNGKVDRAALPDPEAISERTYEPPQDEVERALALIWADVLGLDRVGRQDNFFELGGHSLSVMEMTALVRQRTGIELPLRAVFATATLAELASTVTAKGDFQRQRAEQLAVIDALLVEME